MALRVAKTLALAMPVMFVDGLRKLNELPTPGEQAMQSIHALKNMLDLMGPPREKAAASTEKLDPVEERMLGVRANLTLGSLSDWLKPGETKKPKVLFIAGVEGSGHHILARILNDVATRHPIERIPFPKEWSCGQEWQSIGKQSMIKEFKLIAEQDGTEDGTVYLLPPERAYPECGALDQMHAMDKHEERMRLWHPRLEWIKEAADEAGVELKVMLLYRPLWECTVLDCTQRHVETCHKEATVLQHNGFKLVSDIRTQMSPRDVTCFHTGDLKKMVDTMKSLFGEGDKDIMDTLRKNAEATDDSQSKSWFTWDEDKLLVENADLALRGLCSSLKRLTAEGLESFANH